MTQKPVPGSIVYESRHCQSPGTYQQCNKIEKDEHVLHDTESGSCLPATAPTQHADHWSLCILTSLHGFHKGLSAPLRHSGIVLCDTPSGPYDMVATSSPILRHSSLLRKLRRSFCLGRCAEHVSESDLGLDCLENARVNRKPQKPCRTCGSLKSALRQRELCDISKENAKGLERVLWEGGFRDIEIATETAEFVSADEEEWWWQVWGAGWREHIDGVARADPDHFKQFKAEIFEDLQQHKHEDGVRFLKTVLFAFGTKR
jgi:hypothetical protein